MGSFGPGELIIWLIVVIPMIAVGVAIIRIGFRRYPRDDSRRVLRERLARGEITQAEFEQTRRALEL